LTDSAWGWAALVAVVGVLLAVDLLLFGGRRGTIPLSRATVWSIWWTVLGLAFCGVLLAFDGRRAAEEYLTGFVLEKSLSLDNLFVFAVVMSHFAVPGPSRRRVLFWGIAGAIVLRGLFILAGAALLHAFHWTTYAFGAFLVATALRMAFRSGETIDLERNRTLRLIRRFVPMTQDYRGERFLVGRGRTLAATPLLTALLAIMVFDVVFAVDSIPAIFAITRDTYVVFAANAFSLLGLAALYFLLVGMLERFAHLHYGLAGALAVVGAKMVVADVVTVSTWVVLLAVLAALTLAALTSLLSAAVSKRRARDRWGTDPMAVRLAGPQPERITPAEAVPEAATHSARPVKGGAVMAKARDVAAAAVEAFNAHDETWIRSIYADDVVFEAPGDVRLEGRDAAVRYVTAWLRAFPDAEIRVDVEVADGDWVAQRFMFEGTHEDTLVGPAGEIPATNRRLAVRGFELLRVRNGEIVEDYLSFDQAEVLTQLGLIPELLAAASSWRS
jgi:tellurite resistance protein TerC